MSPDVTSLDSLRSYRDETRGITERFEILDLRSGWTVGVLSLPTGPSQPIGWLMCHSFGSEQWHLYATEVAIARELASHGFPVLRFQCQGYGDSERLDVLPSASSHLADTSDALSLLRSVEGVQDVGLIGLRFGAAIAFMTAAQASARPVVLVDPVVNGAKFIRQLLRSRAIVELTADVEGERVEPGANDGDLHAILRAGGVVSVRGYTITPEVYQGIREVDLTKAGGFDGKALIVQVSRSERPAPGPAGFAHHLEAHGSSVESVIVSGPYAALFGEGHFLPVEGDEMGDALVGVNTQVAADVAEWVVASAS